MNENKENVISIYYKIMKNINININHQKLLFYTDEFKTPGGTGAAVILMSNENVYNWARHQNIHANMKFDENQKFIDKN